MAVTVKKIALWRNEVRHEAGVLADVLEPLTAAGVNLRVLSGYAFPGDSGQGAIEIFPVSGKRATAAAKRAGFTPSSIACLLVDGDDRPGLGGRMARALADAGINISFVMATTVGRKFTAVFGFEDERDAAGAARAIKAAAKARR